MMYLFQYFKEILLDIIRINISLKKSESVSYVGITIDNRLNYATHINNKVTSLSSVCRRKVLLLNNSTGRKIYMAYLYKYHVKTHISYDV